ncbi:unnamed protein product, partial [Phaeothamnion confervicola]
MADGYFNIEAILQAEERVPCTFQSDAQDMGVLDPTTGEQHLRAGSKA